MGYFAALYRKVTVAVKEGIEEHFFDDGERMERLDVTFANRYLSALEAYRHHAPVTESWRLAFDTSQSSWPIVIQHLLLGMNAHINLDLGIAAAQTVSREKLPTLKADFYRINEILNELTAQVQNELAEVWPPFKWFDLKAKNFDELMARFGIELARDHAWKVANKLSELPAEQWNDEIARLDLEVAKFGKCLILPRSWWLRAGLLIVRLGEERQVRKVIETLN